MEGTKDDHANKHQLQHTSTSALSHIPSQPGAKFVQAICNTGDASNGKVLAQPAHPNDTLPAEADKLRASPSEQSRRKPRRKKLAWMLDHDRSVMQLANSMAARSSGSRLSVMTSDCDTDGHDNEAWLDAAPVRT